VALAGDALAREPDSGCRIAAVFLVLLDAETVAGRAGEHLQRHETVMVELQAELGEILGGRLATFALPRLFLAMFSRSSLMPCPR
jgi:hypothetical protein